VIVPLNNHNKFKQYFQRESAEYGNEKDVGNGDIAADYERIDDSCTFER